MTRGLQKYQLNLIHSNKLGGQQSASRLDSDEQEHSADCNHCEENLAGKGDHGSSNINSAQF
ncbi:unnamed protein product [Mortierella alpina]